MDPIHFLRNEQPKAPVPQAARGFTLVEMLVVLSIIVILTVVAVTGQGTFNRSLLLTDTAYTVAFSIREAQTLGLSSRIFNSVTNSGYGIRFDRSTPTAYVEFADIYPASPGDTQGGWCPGHTNPASSPDAHPGNCLYDASQSELVRTYALNRGFNISSFCGLSTNGSLTVCSGSQIDTLDIVFMRPSTSAVLLGKSSSGSVYPLSNATLHLKSPDSVTERCIYITSVGQISVISCP